MNFLISKKDLEDFIKKLSKNHEILAPVKKGSAPAAFSKVTSFSEIYFDGQTTFGIRKYFAPDKETLFKFKNNKIIPNPPNKKKRILILRPCDANALAITDKIYLDQNPDSLYKEKRKNTLLFVFKCTKPFENCFCTSLNTDDTTNYDLRFIDLGEKLIVTPNSKKGESLIENKAFRPIIRDGRVKITCNKEATDLQKLDRFREDPAWKEAVDKCINCNACISVCPTCSCFDIRDELEIDQKTGKRVRYWSYCHMKDFTKVAGNHIFREEREERFKHRIYHKLNYFKEKHGKHMCVGCGRCIDVCPVGIDMLEIIKKLGK